MFAVTPWSSRHHLRINVLWRNHIFCHITPRKQGFGLSQEQQSCESGRRTVDWGQSQPPWPWQPRRPPAVKSAAGSPAIKVPQPATEINHPFFKDTKKKGNPNNIRNFSPLHLWKSILQQICTIYFILSESSWML